MSYSMMYLIWKFRIWYILSSLFVNYAKAFQNCCNIIIILNIWKPIPTLWKIAFLFKMTKTLINKNTYPIQKYHPSSFLNNRENVFRYNRILWRKLAKFKIIVHIISLSSQNTKITTQISRETIQVVFLKMPEFGWRVAKIRSDENYFL